MGTSRQAYPVECDPVRVRVEITRLHAERRDRRQTPHLADFGGQALAALWTAEWFERLREQHRLLGEWARFTRQPSAVRQGIAQAERLAQQKALSARVRAGQWQARAAALGDAWAGRHLDRSNGGGGLMAAVVSLANKVNVGAVNRQALKKYGEFWAALNAVGEAVEQARKVAAQISDGEAGGPSRATLRKWSMPTGDEVTKAVRKCDTALGIIVRSARKWEAELVSREWRR